MRHEERGTRNAVAAKDSIPEVTGHVMPLDPIAVLVVQDGEAGLVMELLQPLNGDPDVVVRLDRPLLDPLVVVRLGDPSLSCGGPEGLRVRLQGPNK
jgi:hypothetical protein